MLASQRGQKVALTGLVAHLLVLTPLAVALRWFTGTPAAVVAMWLVLAPLGLWVITLVLFYCRFLERREAAELEHLAARGESPEGIFAGQEEQAHVAATRLRWMQRYLVPAFTLAFAAYHIAMGLVLARWVIFQHEFVTPFLKAVGLTVGRGGGGAFFIALGGAFVAFLFSRYVTGMAKAPAWALLRAPGSYLFTNAVIFLLLAGAIGAAHYQADAFGKVLAYILPIFMIVIGAELVLNFVLDLYRPRVPGAEARPSYDSRMLNLIASPESIGHSIAEALNYQFGFEVSSTWFYRLLQRAFVPLVLSGAAIMWLLTSVVVVDESEQYVVLHWGRIDRGRVLTPRPAPYLIWPWPIDTARRFETGAIHEILLGVGRERTEEFINGKRVYLWGEEHGNRQELDTLVAIPPTGSKPKHEGVPSVNVIKLVVGVYYRIADPVKYGYKVRNARRLLESIAYREMTEYAASATLYERLADAAAAKRPQGIMSFGRRDAAAALKTRIEAAAGAADLGVEIVDVTFLSCHPPVEAVASFETVIAAEREQDKKRYAAQAEAQKTLADTAGDPDEALLLAQAIEHGRDLRAILNDRRTGAAVTDTVDKSLAQARQKIERLSEEIEMERLLGRIKPGKETIAQVLLARELDHEALLKQVKAAPKQYDLTGAVRAGQERVDQLFAAIQGRAAVLIAEARADRWKKELAERARADTFAEEVRALKAAPFLYRFAQRLDVMAEGLKTQRKYVLGMDRGQVNLWMGLQRQDQPLEDIPLTREDLPESK